MYRMKERDHLDRRDWSGARVETPTRLLFPGSARRSAPVRWVYRWAMVLGCLLAGVGNGRSQQLVDFGQFRSFYHVFNPAGTHLFGGSDPDRQWLINLAARRQWTAVGDAPQTALASLLYTDQRHNFSLGAAAVHDRFGPAVTTQFRVHYAYQIRMMPGDEQFLSLGISLAGAQLQLDGGAFRPQHPDDQLLFEGLQSATFITGSVGVYYQQQARYGDNPVYLFLGAAMQQLLPVDVIFTSVQGDEANLPREYHPQAQLGARIYYGYYEDYVEPVIWWRSAANAPSAWFFGVRTTFLDQRFMGGAAVSSNWEAHFQAGISPAPAWMILYGVSAFLETTFNAPSGLTHEIGLQLGF